MWNVQLDLWNVKWDPDPLNANAEIKLINVKLRTWHGNVKSEMGGCQMGNQEWRIAISKWELGIGNIILNDRIKACGLQVKMKMGIHHFPFCYCECHIPDLIFFDFGFYHNGKCQM